MTYDYDARGLQTLWKSTNSREIRRSYFPSGQLRMREAEEPNGQGGLRTRTYYFGYNANRSKVQMRDEDLNRTTDLYYDEAERETVVDETWDETGDLPAGRDTATAYDRDGNATSRQTDGIATVSEDGEVTGYQGHDGEPFKETTYAYDELDREVETTADPSSGASRTTRTSYHPSGEMAARTKPSGVVESTYFDERGELTQTVRGRPNQALAKDQTYAYDREGNRTKDERGTYAYNARDQLTAWSQPGESSPYATYEVNGSGAVTKQTEAGVEETRTYRGDQLVSAQTGTTTKRFEYDPYGNMSEEWVDTDGEPAPTEPETSYRYDAFERLQCTGPGEASQTSECKGTDVTYSYDGLDRRDYRKEGQTRYDSSYVGQSEALSREEDPGNKTQLYDYDSQGDGQGQATTAAGSTDYHSFAKDANGSVEGFEDQNGGAREHALRLRPLRQGDQQADRYGGEGEPNPLPRLPRGPEYRLVRHAGADVPPGRGAIPYPGSLRGLVRGLQLAVRSAHPEPVRVRGREPGEPCGVGWARARLYKRRQDPSRRHLELRSGRRPQSDKQSP